MENRCEFRIETATPANGRNTYFDYFVALFRSVVQSVFFFSWIPFRFATGSVRMLSAAPPLFRFNGDGRWRTNSEIIMHIQYSSLHDATRTRPLRIDSVKAESFSLLVVRSITPWCFIHSISTAICPPTLCSTCRCAIVRTTTTTSTSEQSNKRSEEGKKVCMWKQHK